MYEGREVFANPPVELVAVEIRFPDSARLRQPGTLDELQLALEDILPVRRAEQTTTVAVPLGGQVLSQVHEQVPLFLDRDATTSAAFRPTALTVETTHYQDFATFLGVIGRCTSVLAQQRAAPGVERVGLRYIDEIRVPDPISDAGSWEGWVSDWLLAAGRLGGSRQPSGLQGMVQFDRGDHRRLVVRYATQVGTGVVQPTSLRRRHEYPHGAFFVLDFDSFWQGSASRVDEFDPERIAELLGDLHAPVGETFQLAITDRLRDELRKVP
ncbi:MAG: TIGR04255 family protein [Actinomycetota bacterium]|jgi:uncharacterized protein (TIGR04255 family)|nr:TIGR04255 family protein [Actinomycetota bacterium]